MPINKKTDIQRAEARGLAKGRREARAQVLSLQKQLDSMRTQRDDYRDETLKLKRTAERA